MAYFDTKGLFGTTPEEMQREIFEKSQARRQKEMEFLASGTLTPGATYLGLKTLEPLRTAFDRTGEDPRVQQLREQSQAAQQAMQGFDLTTRQGILDAASRLMQLGMVPQATKLLNAAKERQSGVSNYRLSLEDIANLYKLDLNDPEQLAKADKIFREQKRQSLGEVAGKADIANLSSYVKDTMIPSSKKAKDAKGTINRLKGLLPKINTGAFEEVKLTGKRVLQALGVSDEAMDNSIANQEAFQSQAFGRVMDYVQETKGAVSNREMDLFARAEVGLTKSKKGNALIIAIAERAANTELELQKYYREWKGKNPEAGYSQWQAAEIEWLEKNGWRFSEEEMAEIEAAANQAAGLAPTQATPEQPQAVQPTAPSERPMTQAMEDFTSQVVEMAMENPDQVPALKAAWEAKYPNLPFPVATDMKSGTIKR
jgi:hypothetical protein